MQIIETGKAGVGGCRTRSAERSPTSGWSHLCRPPRRCRRSRGRAPQGIMRQHVLQIQSRHDGIEPIDRNSLYLTFTWPGPAGGISPPQASHHLPTSPTQAPRSTNLPNWGVVPIRGRTQHRRHQNGADGRGWPRSSAKTRRASRRRCTTGTIGGPENRRSPRVRTVHNNNRSAGDIIDCPGTDPRVDEGLRLAATDDPTLRG